MLKDDFKRRMSALFFVLLFSIIPFILSYFSLRDYLNYLNYPEVVVYSRFDVVLILSPFIFFPFSFLGAFILFSGKKAPHKHQKIVNQFVVVSFFCILLLTILSSVLYTNNLEAKGYVHCSGIPSGWAPGMATKYAHDESLCHQSAH